ncbi:MAG: hypothetical protein H7829_17615 [Magnetococcus sp. THC-1_WYH]
MMAIMERSDVESPSQNASKRDGDPLNLKGSYDAPAFIRLGRKLGSDVPFAPPGVLMDYEVSARHS